MKTGWIFRCKSIVLYVALLVSAKWTASLLLIKKVVEELTLQLSLKVAKS